MKKIYEVSTKDLRKIYEIRFRYDELAAYKLIVPWGKQYSLPLHSIISVCYVDLLDPVCTLICCF